MEDGGWRMEDGGWRMDDRRLRMGIAPHFGFGGLEGLKNAGRRVSHKVCQV